MLCCEMMQPVEADRRGHLTRSGRRGGNIVAAATVEGFVFGLQGIVGLAKLQEAVQEGAEEL